MFQDIDNLWEKILHYSDARDLQAVRIDCYLRKQDRITNDQKVFVSVIKNSLLGGRHAPCPCCFQKVSFVDSDLEKIHECATCKRIYLLRGE